MPLLLNSVGKALFLGCLSTTSICLFVRPTVFHEWLEQCEWYLQRIFIILTNNLKKERLTSAQGG